MEWNCRKLNPQSNFGRGSRYSGTCWCVVWRFTTFQKNRVPWTRQERLPHRHIVVAQNTRSCFLIITKYFNRRASDVTQFLCPLQLLAVIFVLGENICRLFDSHRTVTHRTVEAHTKTILIQSYSERVLRVSLFWRNTWRIMQNRDLLSIQNVKWDTNLFCSTFIYLARIHEWPMTFHKAWQQTMCLAPEWKRGVVHMLISSHYTMGSGLYCWVACSCRWSICVSATAGSCVSCGIVSGRKSWTSKKNSAKKLLQWISMGSLRFGYEMEHSLTVIIVDKASRPKDGVKI